jgi:RNA polymerase sigma-70 factor (ECF subfamily)
MPAFSEQADAEHQLAAALREGKPDAPAQLYDRYAAVLLGFLVRLLPDKEVAEKVLCTTLLRAWHEIETFEPANTRLLTWLLRIARDTALDILLAKPAATAGEPGPGAVVHSAENSTFVPAKDEKAALDLIYLKGYSCTQAAEALCVPQNRLREMLRTAIKELNGVAAA